jgi:hypothetical protein
MVSVHHENDKPFHGSCVIGDTAGHSAVSHSRKYYNPATGETR